MIPRPVTAPPGGMIALLIAVLPANIYMAAAHVDVSWHDGSKLAQWMRIPLQLLLIYWAWIYTER
jgi:uncharacterized membrane protein